MPDPGGATSNAVRKAARLASTSPISCAAEPAPNQPSACSTGSVAAAAICSNVAPASANLPSRRYPLAAWRASLEGRSRSGSSNAGVEAGGAAVAVAVAAAPVAVGSTTDGSFPEQALPSTSPNRSAGVARRLPSRKERLRSPITGWMLGWRAPDGKDFGPPGKGTVSNWYRRRQPAR